MRLSEKGLGNVFYHQSLDLDIDSYEFKPEDFTGSVVLTVEEAKGVAATYDALANFLIKCMDGEGSKEAISFAMKLNERIEQAEKKK